MRTAVDTNVLIDVAAFTGNASDEARDSLLLAGMQGPLMMSILCYAEIAQRFLGKRVLDQFISGLQIEVSPISEEQAFTAGKFYQSYLGRGGKRQRILPDFLVAAHAMLEADRLLTLDGRFYGPSFPALRALSPAELLSTRR